MKKKTKTPTEQLQLQLIELTKQYTELIKNFNSLVVLAKPILEQQIRNFNPGDVRQK